MNRLSPGSNVLLVLLSIALMLVVGYVVYGELIYRENIGITIDDRYWVWSKKYTYTAITLMPVTTSHTTIINGKSVTTTSTELRPVENTYTRCEAESAGRDLNVYPPDMPCEKFVGDLIDETLVYYVVYHKWDEAEQVTSPIAPNAWDKFSPEGSERVTVNLFGRIVNRLVFARR